MDWLKDKKNQPIVAAIAAVVIVGVLVFMYFTVFKKDSGDSTYSETTSGQEMAAGQPAPEATMPVMPPAGGAVPTAPAATPVAPQPKSGEAAVAAQPMETWRADPFLPVGYKRPGPVRTKPRIEDFPFPVPKRFYKEPPEELKPEEPQPARRLAGVMQNMNGGVYAIIESGGKSQVVQPGETLADRLAMVEKIEPDKVLLKTLGDRPRYIVVALAAAPRRQAEVEVTETTGAYTGRPARTPGGAMPPEMMLPETPWRPQPRRR
jgi:hypothetical protein